MSVSADRIITTVTMLCEATPEDGDAQAWVIWAIRNRAASGRFEKTMAGVCLQRMQFSEWNADRQDNANLERVANMAEDDPQWQAGLALYDEIMGQDPSSDPTSGATHFYAVSIPAPIWTLPPAVLVGQQGRVRFYANVS